MKIVTPKCEEETPFGQLKAGQVFRASSGHYYMKTAHCREKGSFDAIDLATGHLSSHWDRGTVTHIKNARLVLGGEEA